MNKIILVAIVTIFLQGCSTHHHTVETHNKVEPSKIKVIDTHKTSANTSAPQSISRSVLPNISNKKVKEYRCAELSKAEAYTHLSAGHTYLDRDNDGHPCEWNKKKPSYTSTPSNSSNCHYVSGYYRKSGTYVKGHTRCR